MKPQSLTYSLCAGLFFGLSSCEKAEQIGTSEFALELNFQSTHTTPQSLTILVEALGEPITFQVGVSGWEQYPTSNILISRNNN